MEPLYLLLSERSIHIMTAPMSTLQRVFALTQSAVEQIERETVAGGECILRLNACGWTDWQIIIRVRRLPQEIQRQAG